MGLPFLVTGLPRSRTAWWSIVASTPVSTCTHEPMKHTANFDQLAEFWKIPRFDFVGVSDSAVAPQLGRVLAEIGPRTLMVVRDRVDVEKSLDGYFAGCTFDRDAGARYLQETEDQLSKWAGHDLVKCVRFEALADYDVVADCFNWLMPGNPFAPREELMHMNVQVALAYALTESAKPHSHWYRTA